MLANQIDLISGVVLIIASFLLFKDIKSDEKVIRYYFENIERFHLDIIKWCNDHFKINEISPQLVIAQNTKEKKRGEYHIKNRQIIIYLEKIKNPKESVNVTIHEYVHFIQHLKDSRFDINYTLSGREFGYEMNPYEIEANNIAKIKSREYISYLKESL